MESLTQLTSLHHLRLELSHPGPVPQTFKHSLIKIIRNLAELQSIDVYVWVDWSEEERMEVIQETRHLTHLQIVLLNNISWIFNYNITSSHEMKPPHTTGLVIASAAVGINSLILIFSCFVAVLCFV